jgi:hypothetical protein
MLKSTLRYEYGTWLDPMRGSVEEKTMNIESGSVFLFAVLIVASRGQFLDPEPDQDF